MNALADSIVDDLYEAAVLPELWPKVLERVAGSAKSFGATIFAVDSLQRGCWVASPSLQDVMEQLVDAPYARNNTRPARALSTRYAGFLADLELLSAEEKEQDPLYTELLRPNGLAWASGCVVPSPSGDLLVIDVERTVDQGPFDRQALDTLDGFRPHLARAGLLASRLQLARAQAAASVMQSLGLPGAVLGARGRVLAMNPLLEGLAPQLHARAFDRLTAAHSPANDMLETALSQVGATDAGIRSIPIPAAEDRPGLVVHILPVRKQAHDIFSGATALLVATPLLTPAPPVAGLLCGLFDLTPAEDRVARAIAEGHSVESYAAKMSVSQNTVRSQLKSIMLKTGTSRQAELVGLLAGTHSAPLRTI